MRSGRAFFMLRRHCRHRRTRTGATPRGAGYGCLPHRHIAQIYGGTIARNRFAASSLGAGNSLLHGLSLLSGAMDAESGEANAGPAQVVTIPLAVASGNTAFKTALGIRRQLGRVFPILSNAAVPGIHSGLVPSTAYMHRGCASMAHDESLVRPPTFTEIGFATAEWAGPQLRLIPLDPNTTVAVFVPSRVSMG
jgi:hypothetical protein